MSHSLKLTSDSEEWARRSRAAPLRHYSADVLQIVSALRTPRTRFELPRVAETVTLSEPDWRASRQRHPATRNACT